MGKPFLTGIDNETGRNLCQIRIYNLCSAMNKDFWKEEKSIVFIGFSGVPATPDLSLFKVPEGYSLSCVRNEDSIYKHSFVWDFFIEREKYEDFLPEIKFEWDEDTYLLSEIIKKQVEELDRIDR